MAVTTASLRTAVMLELEASEPRSRAYETPITNAAGTGVTITVGDGDAFQVGDLIETPSGERALVTAIATNSLTVKRAVRGITVETLSSGDIIKKNPRFSLEAVDSAVTGTLHELNPRIFTLLTEVVAYTVDDWYDVTDVAMEEVLSAWYIDQGDFFTPYFFFNTDPANSQPKIFLGSAGFTGNINVMYRRPYALVTELPDRLSSMMANGAVYRLLGGAGARATEDIGKRTDRTIQGGQEHRDSYWYLREFTRLRDAERVYLDDQLKKLPRNRISQRSRRFVK